MYYETKYVTIITDVPIAGEEEGDLPPKLYIDWFYFKPNKLYKYSTSKEFVLRVGFFKHYLAIHLQWGFING